MRTANSSPPSRAAVSEGRRQPAEGGGHPLEEGVPLAVPEAVVHGLEVVEVDEEHGQVRARALVAGQGVVEAVLEEGLVGQAGQRVVEGPVGQLVLEPLAVGDVAEAHDPADDATVHPLRPAGPFHHPAVPELQNVEALVFRREGSPLLFADGGLGVRQLVEREGQGGRVALLGHELLGQVPNFGEAAVRTGDPPVGADHQNAVRRRFQRGGQAREGLAQLAFGRDLRRRIVGRDDEALDGRVVQQVHDAELEGHRAGAVVAHESEPGGDRVRRRRPPGRGAQRSLEPVPVLGGDQVDQGLALHQLGVVSEEARDGARHRLEGAVGRDLHEDVAGIVHERAHLALVAPAHLIAAALGEIAHAEQNGALAVPLHRGADDFDQAPPRCGVDPDLDRCADVAAVDGGQRAQHELLVVRVHQVQARPADGVADRPLEHALGRGVPPDDVPVRVDHDDRIGQAQEGFDDGIGLVDGPARLGRGLELTRDRVQRVPTFSSLPGARPYQL